MYGRRPLTKLEAGLFAGCVGIFLTVFAHYMLGYMEIAERVAMQATLINTSGAINVRLAQAFLGQQPGPKDVTARNPFDVAGVAPPNFARNADLSTLGSGQWAYDSEHAELVYVPRLRSGLRTEGDDQALRFRLVREGAAYSFRASRPFTWE